MVLMSHREKSQSIGFNQTCSSFSLIGPDSPIDFGCFDYKTTKRVGPFHWKSDTTYLWPKFKIGHDPDNLYRGSTKDKENKRVFLLTKDLVDFYDVTFLLSVSRHREEKT